MTIGIDGSRAFLRYRTGIEAYSYHIIRALTQSIPESHSVRLYVKARLCFRDGWFHWEIPDIDFSLPEQWEIRPLFAPRFWTQGRLSLEMLLHPVETLFIPAHTIPLIHPAKTIVTIHGLEYEFYPESYGFWERFYMRASIFFSVRVASRVIAVSQNTKKDLEQLYSVPPENIEVIGEGYETGKFSVLEEHTHQTPYILFVGRLEQRKNIEGIIRAFEQWKTRTQTAMRLVLVGKPGHGYEVIKKTREVSPYQSDIEERGYVEESVRNELLRGATLFLFPSLYEGFGLPILEAQSFGIPVVTSSTSSLPEVAGDGAVLVDPESSQSIAEGIDRVLTLSESERASLIAKGKENTKRFSWQEAGQRIARILA